MATARLRLFMVTFRLTQNSIRCALRTMLVWWRVFDPPCTGRSPVTTQQKLRALLLFVIADTGCIQSTPRLFDALLNRLVSGDRRFAICDGLEPRLHFQVEREGSVVRGMQRIGFEVETAASGFIGTGALDDRPGLSEFAGELENAVDLVAAGEGAAVEKDFASRSGLQQEACSLEHDLHYEVVLLDGVFDIFRREQGGADLVFAEERVLRAASQFASERGFAGTGKTGHQNNHSAEIVAEAECRWRLSWRRSLRRLRSLVR